MKPGEENALSEKPKFWKKVKLGRRTTEMIINYTGENVYESDSVHDNDMR